MKGRAIYFLMVLVMGYTGSAVGGGPVGVSPGGEGSIAVINQECPTFSWSQVEGAISYTVKVFERVNEEALLYEEMEQTAEPVMSVEIKAPALSWTPSAGECFVAGKRYVWYVGAISSLSPLRLRGDEEGLRQWSNGKAFEVDIGVSAGMKDALKETVKEYLTKEWISTESYQEVRKEITQELTKAATISTSGASGTVKAAGTVVPQAIYETGTNTFLGQNAGAGTVAGGGSSDTFIGGGAGQANTSGYANTFVGYAAGTTNTTAINNTFVGQASGWKNTSGHDNTFMGNGAGLYNTTGSENTFIGAEAGTATLADPVVGGQNSFLGYRAGYKNTSGVGNSFMGWQAGYNNTTGSNNSFLGSQAGYNNIDGFGNTFVGTGAGANNIAGTGNVFLGISAGYSQTYVNHRLYIDNCYTGVPCNQPLVYGEFDNRLVRIDGRLEIVTIAAPSDGRYKKDIHPLDSSLDKVLHLQGVSYEWKIGELKGVGYEKGRQIGLIAQEVEKVLPELVHTDDKGYKALSYDRLVPVLIEAVKEQQKEIMEKDACIKRLEKAVEMMERRLTSLENPGEKIAYK